MEFGIVKSYLYEQQIGFIVTKSGGRDIFFHVNNGRILAESLSGEARFTEQKLQALSERRVPKRGDELAFEFVEHSKSLKAGRWGFADTLKKHTPIALRLSSLRSRNPDLKFQRGGMKK